MVPDLANDVRFQNNPLVAEAGGLRFYAGALLITPDGFPLGTVCVLDTVPRPARLDQREVRVLQMLARQVMSELEQRRALREATHGGASGAKRGQASRDGAATGGELNHRVKNNLATVQAIAAQSLLQNHVGSLRELESWCC